MALWTTSAVKTGASTRPVHWYTMLWSDMIPFKRFLREFATRIIWYSFSKLNQIRHSISKHRSNLCGSQLTSVAYRSPRAQSCRTTAPTLEPAARSDPLSSQGAKLRQVTTPATDISCFTIFFCVSHIRTLLPSANADDESSE